MKKNRNWFTDLRLGYWYRKDPQEFICIMGMIFFGIWMMLEISPYQQFEESFDGPSWILLIWLFYFYCFLLTGSLISKTKKLKRENENLKERIEKLLEEK